MNNKTVFIDSRFLSVNSDPEALMLCSKMFKELGYSVIKSDSFCHSSQKTCERALLDSDAYYMHLHYEKDDYRWVMAEKCGIPVIDYDQLRDMFVKEFIKERG